MFVTKEFCASAASKRDLQEVSALSKCSRSVVTVSVLLALSLSLHASAASADTPAAPARNLSADAIAQQFSQPPAAAAPQPAAPGDRVPSSNVPVVRYEPGGAGDGTSAGVPEARLTFVPREALLGTIVPAAPVSAPAEAFDKSNAAAAPVAADAVTPSATPSAAAAASVAAVEPESPQSESSATLNSDAEPEPAAPVVKRTAKPRAQPDQVAEPEEAKPKRVRVHKHKVVKPPVVVQKPEPEEKGVARRQPPRKAVPPPEDDEPEQAEVKNKAPVRKPVQTLAPASNAEQPSALSNLGTKILSTLGLIPSEPGVPLQQDWQQRQ